MGKPEIALIPATPMTLSVDSKTSSTTQVFFPTTSHDSSNAVSSQARSTTTTLQDVRFKINDSFFMSF